MADTWRYQQPRKIKTDKITNDDLNEPDKITKILTATQNTLAGAAIVTGGIGLALANNARKFTNQQDRLARDKWWADRAAGTKIKKKIKPEIVVK